MSAVTLEDLIKSLKSAVINASKVLETTNINTIHDYFNDDGTPKTLPIKVGDKTSQIPLYTLINSQNLNISELEISFQTKLFSDRMTNESGSLAADVSGSADPSGSLDTSGLYCDIHDPKKSQDTGSATIKMTFKMGDKPEAVSRINDMLIQGYNL
jgi:hypothetical protein